MFTFSEVKKKRKRKEKKRKQNNGWSAIKAEDIYNIFSLFFFESKKGKENKYKQN